MNVLVVAAHPDDEVLGCGGSIARYADEGHRVDVLILGEGATSRHEDRSQADPEVVAALRSAASRAHEILGATSGHVHDLPDNRFDSVPLLNIVKIIERAIDEFAPQIVLTQHGGDTNVDHRLTFRAVLAATRPLPGHPVREVHAFPVASSTEWAFGQLTPHFQATLFIDVSDYLETKLTALECYADELRAYPHPRSLEHVRDQARVFGASVGVAAAEAFHTVRIQR